MADWVLYLDESGSPKSHHLPLKDGETPVFTLGGAALPLDQWREYDRAYLRLKLKFFENEINASSSPAPLWEFKGNRLIQRRNANSQRLKAFAYKTLDIVKNSGGKLFATTILKDDRTPNSSVSLYAKALQIVAEKFDIFLREQDSTGIIVIDSRMAHTKPGAGIDYAIATSYLSFIFGNEEGRQLKRIVEAPMFADSAVTVGLQIADIAAALMYANTYAYHLAPKGADSAMKYLDYLHARIFWKPLRSLEFQSAKTYSGYRQYGYRTLDHRSVEPSQELKKLEEILEGSKEKPSV